VRMEPFESNLTDATEQPSAVRWRTNHDEYIADHPHGQIPAAMILPCDLFELVLTFEPHNLRVLIDLGNCSVLPEQRR
jgi:hypothetical protein